MNSDSGIYENKTFAQRNRDTAPLHHTAHTGKPLSENINAHLVTNNTCNVPINVTLIKARSCNHCCSGKAISIAYSDSVSVASVI